MAGNSRRRGARRTGAKKGPTTGSGGQRRRGLEGKGPTPPAEMRPGHPASRKSAGRPAPRRSGRPVRRRGTGPGDGTEVVAGRNPVAEALRAGVPASTLYVAIGVELDDRVTDAVRLAGDRGLPILEVDRRELDRLVGGPYHQGVGLRVPEYEYAHPDDVLARATDSGTAALLVALDGVTDPRNLGAVVRSAAAFGAHGVVVPERRSAGMTAAAWRTSAGTAARLPVAKATNLTRALTSYQGAGLLAVGLDARGEVSLDDLVAATEPLVLVVGSEGRGLSRLVGERCDLRVAIPMAGRTESLNASAAAAVALAEIARRRRIG